MRFDPPLPGRPPEGSRAAVVLAYTFLVLACAATFAQVRANAPVWDDALLTVDNPFLRSWHGVSKLVTTDLWTASALQEPSRFYRPLPMISYLIDARLFGQTSLAFHAVNVVFHAVNTVLLGAYLRARALARGLVLPCLVALSFAVAPVNVEAVAWISGRFDLLGTLLVLSALLANRGENARAAAATVLLLGLALLCKESFALGAALVVLDDLLLLGRDVRASLAKYAACAASIVAFLVARRLVGVVSVSALAQTGVLALVASYAFLVATYARVIVDPRVLDPFRPYAPFGVLGTVLVLAGVVSLAVGAAFCARLASRHARPDPRFGALPLGVAWVLVGFLPVTLTGPNLDMVGDRYAYFPLLGAFVAACALASLAGDALAKRLGPPRARRLAVAATALALTMLAAEVVRVETRLLDWRDERTLYEASLRDDPENAYALYSLGSLEAQAGAWQAAEEYLGRALAEKPRAWRSLDALCYVRLHEQRLASAERLCQESVASNPSNPRAWINLASAYVNGRAWAPGLDAASKAVELKPGAAEPHFLRAVCLANLEAFDPAQEELRTALRLDPHHAGSLDLLRQFEQQDLR